MNLSLQKIENLTSKQAEFIYSTKKFPCYGGGFGNGKTTAGCIRAILFSTLFPGNLGLVGRAQYPELCATTRAEFFELLPTKLIAKWREKDNHLWLKNGSQIYFRHLDAPGDRALNEIKSLNLGWFYFDQAEEITEQMFLMLMGRLRRNVPRVSGWITDNPDGHNWIWKYWANPMREKYTKKPEDYHLVEATTSENPYLPDGYLQMLMDNFPEDWIKRYVFGNRDTASGLVYPDYDDVSCVCDVFDIPESWDKFRVIDWGAVNATCCLWLTVDPEDQTLYVYDEYYVPNEPSVPIHSEAIKSRYLDKDGSPISFYTLIDPSTKARTREKGGKYYSVHQEFAENGIYCDLANPDFQSRFTGVSHLLKTGKLKVFRHCEFTRWEFGKYKIKQVKYKVLETKNQPEKPQKKDDHAMDALGYGSVWYLTGAKKYADPAVSKESLPARLIRIYREKKEGRNWWD